MIEDAVGEAGGLRGGEGGFVGELVVVTVDPDITFSLAFSL